MTLSSVQPLTSNPLARVSLTQRTAQIGNAVAAKQRAILDAQREIDTGRRVHTPGDDPVAGTLAQQVRRQLEAQAQHLANLDRSTTQLNAVDANLDAVTGLLREATEIAAANVGSDVPTDARVGAAEVVKGLYRQVLALANAAHQGSHLYAGDRLTSAPYVEEGAGVRFVGGNDLLANVVGSNATSGFQVAGAAVFGGAADLVAAPADLTPAAASATRLIDLGGAGGYGVTTSIIRLGNGTSAATVDLRGADTLADVVTRINTAGVGSIVATVTPDGLRLDGAAGETIGVEDLAGGTAARDLGLSTSATTGTPLVGQPVRPLVTPRTPLASLRGGVGIDLSGLTVSQSGVSTTIDLTAASTVEDVLNRLNESSTGLRAEITPDGRSIRLRNPTQGTAASVGENGGTTATDLGVRTLAADTLLTALNDGRGVRTADGADVRVTDSSGASIDLDFATATSVQDVLDAINGGGIGVNATLAAVGNGIVLTDTAGLGTPTLTPLNRSPAATDLGLDATPAGATLSGRDVGVVSPSGLFAHLQELIAGLQTNDSARITRSGEALHAGTERVIRIRGETGARVRELESRHERLSDQNLAARTMLSDLEDADFAESVLKFQTLQTSLQATLQSGARLMNLSLMDYLA